MHNKKAKRKGQKHRSGGKYLVEESKGPTSKEVAEKTLDRLCGLGDQIFAFSPFSQYFDNWLLGLKSVLSEFESNPAANMDKEFMKESSQVIADIELKLSERRYEEAVLEKVTRSLANQKNLLVQIDTEYASATHKLMSQKNSDIRRLTCRIHDFEEELEETSRMKASIFSPSARRPKSHKTGEITLKLDSAKSKFESIVKTFEIKQRKLHDKYAKRRQAVMEQVRSLEKKVGGLETDCSAEDRRIACDELVNAIKAFLQRKKFSS